MTDWPFDQPEKAATVTCETVIDGAPILLVVHYSDDHSWAFLDGAELDMAGACLVSLGTLIRLDPTLLTIAGLPPGWVARREAPGGPWAMAPDPEV